MKRSRSGDEPAATIAGFAVSPLSAASFREITTAIAHLREVLGDQTYESLARTGRDDDDLRHCGLRIRPNRPGPSRTEGGLEHRRLFRDIGFTRTVE